MNENEDNGMPVKQELEGIPVNVDIKQEEISQINNFSLQVNWLQIKSTNFPLQDTWKIR